jgi:hypothetical protein
MLLEMLVKKEMSDKDALPELVEFKGIRWNAYGFVVIYTNHMRHDYIMPMEKEQYVEFEKKIKQAYLKKAKLIEITGDVYRVRKDNYTLSKGSNLTWAVNILE